MGIFDVVSPSLFKPLSGLYKELFAALLDILWDRCKHSHDYSLPRSTMVELLEHYFSGLSIDLSAGSSEAGEDSLEAPAGKDPHAQAIWAVNRLRNSGWLEQVEAGYEEESRIAVVPAVVPLLQAFSLILKPQTVTYSGKLFQAYQLLQTLDREERPYENILKEVSASMDELNHALRNLNASIGTYIERLTRNKTPAEILDLFEQYEEQVVEAAYHRFKTSDNLFSYRGGLLCALDDCDDKYLDALVQDYCIVEQVDPEEGLVRIPHLIQKVRDDIDIMRDLIHAIDDNHILYRKRAVQRAQFMLLTDGTTSGTINELLRFYSETITSPAQLEEEDDTPLSRHWKLYPVKLFGAAYLKMPVQNRPPTPIDTLDMPEPLGTEELLRAQQQLLAFAAAAVTQENVNVFAAKALSGQRARKASLLVGEEPADFIKIVALHTYSNSDSRNYEMELQPNWVKHGRFHFQDFLLKRRF